MGKRIKKGDHFDGAYSLKKNITYKTSDISYQTNDKGKISHFYGDLSNTSAKRHVADQVHLKGKVDGDHAGHLVASEDGGSGYVDNLVPMDGKVNTRDYRAIERENKAIMNNGYNVSLDGDVYYSSNQDRPDAFMVKRETKNAKGEVIDREYSSWTNDDMSKYDNP